MEQHSPLFEKISDWYHNGFWSIKTLKVAVKTKRITADEFKEISGETYEA